MLKHDGSPPAYYMLLGLWIRAFGDGERSTHLLSLIFALACIPLAYAVGRSVFNRTTGIVAATLIAFDPFLTYYAQETRMYTMEAFLSLLVAWAYVQGILRGSRAWCVGLVLSLTLLVYTHNWALFVCAGLAITTAAVARDKWKSFAFVAVGVAVLYAPWLPTLWFQVQHTGAPWSTRPGLHNLILAPGAVLSGDGPFMAFALVGGTGLAAYVRRRDDDDRRIILTLAYMVAFTVVLAWISSQVTPAWTTRYFAVVLGALIVVAARGLVTAGRLGLIALVAVIFIWTGYSAHPDKENARQLAQQLLPGMHQDELVLTTHPEQVPVLRYYFGPSFRYANTFGPVQDPQVFDWVDAVVAAREHAGEGDRGRAGADGQAGPELRRDHAGLPGLPRLGCEVDGDGVEEGRDLDAHPRDRPQARPGPARVDERDRRPFELLQAVAGLRVSPGAVDCPGGRRLLSLS